MNRIHFSTVLALGLSAALAGCSGDGGGGNGGDGGAGATAGAGGTSTAGGAGGTSTAGGAGGAGGGALQWYTTCGDPACGGSTDDANLADCTTEADGDPCAMDGASCEIAGDTCNVNLVCATKDPKGSPEGCPISLASAKHGIQYLTEADRERIRADVVTMPLATWKYNHEARGEKEHLGFIIDDQPPSSAAVRPSGERVDLYGYTSMAVAAIQAQDRQIEALRREVEALRAELAREKGAGVCSP
jgi:hypothetical protein